MIHCKIIVSSSMGIFQEESFEEGCLTVVTLGNDFDTTGTLCGQIASAYCIRDSIAGK